MQPLVTLACLLVAVSCIGEAAKCGDTEFFEFKFKPVKIRPVKDGDIDNSKARCGEKRCDLIVHLFGKDRCKKGDHAVRFSAPGDSNRVEKDEFKPKEYGWKIFSEWKLSNAAHQNFKIQVCDADSWFRGHNDGIMAFDHNRIRKGCHQYRYNDHHPEHPWIFDYELCCRPVLGKN